MPRHAEDMDANAMEQFFNENYQSKILGHYTHTEQAPYDYARGEACFRCDQPRFDVKFDGETEGHGRRRCRTKSHAQHCPSCHCTIQSSKYAARDTARGGGGGGGGVNAVLDQYEDMLKTPVIPASIKKTQSNTLSPRTCSRCHPESVSHHRSKRSSTSGHRQTRRTEQDDRLSAMMRQLMTSGLVHNSAEGQHGFPQTAPIKTALKKDAPRINRQKTRDAPEETDQEADDFSDGDGQDLSDVGMRLTNLDVRDEGWSRQLHRNYQEANKLVSEAREYERYKEQNRQISESAGVEHRVEARGRKQDAADEREQSRKRIIHSASKYTATRYSAPRPNSERPHGSMVRERHIGEQILMKSSRGTERSVKNSSKITTPDAIACDTEQDDLKEEQQLQKELNDIPYCGAFQPPVIFPDSEYKHVKELEDNAEVQKEEENGVMQRSEMDLHAMKNCILNLIDKVLSKALSDVKKTDIAKQEQLQQNVCLEISRLLQDDYCKSLAQSSVGHQTSDYMKQLKNLRFDFLNHIQEEIRKLYNLEMFLDNCSPRQSLPIANSQSGSVDQRNDDRQQQQAQQQQAQQQQVSQEQQPSTTTVGNGLGKKLSELGL